MGTLKGWASAAAAGSTGERRPPTVPDRSSRIEAAAAPAALPWRCLQAPPCYIPGIGPPSAKTRFPPSHARRIALAQPSGASHSLEVGVEDDRGGRIELCRP